MRTLKLLFPPYLLIMILYVQVISFILNYDIFDIRELAIYSCWISLFTLANYFIKNSLFYKFIVFIFFIDGFINLSHLLVLKCPISASSIFVLSNTNLDEAKEFVELKFSYLFLLIIPYFILFYLAVKNVLSVQVYAQSKWILTLIAVGSSVFFLENFLNERFIRKAIPQTAKAFVSFSEELKNYNSLKKRKVVSIDANFVNESIKKQRVFLLIIGESCNRNHMSLYNYKQQTNPLLEKRKDIIVYNNVVSPYSNTLNSVLTILTEANLENKMSFDTGISIIDVFHSLGYKTNWLSNQSPIGVWDNAIYNLAHTSDVSKFVNNNGNTSFESTYLSSYDENVFQPLTSMLSNDNGNKFIVIHLMGSHSSYSKRYPSAFNKFTNYKNDKEQLINEYDNSVLYNDFIVDSLLNMLNTFSINNSIISSAIYLSDHGENVYDENNNAGHNYSGIMPKSNVEIPFIVWLSPSFKLMYANKEQSILLNKNKPFISDDLFHAIIDLNDITCNEYNETRSVFNKNFNFKRTRILEDNLDYDLK